MDQAAQSSSSSSSGSSLRITESDNELTADIDVASPIEILRMLRASHGQLFAGYKGHVSMADDEIAELVDALTDFAAEIVAFAKDSAIILSGCGTSGRIAFHLAWSFNSLLASRKLPRCFRYCIAGGDAAIFRSQEGAEDSSRGGMEDLKKIEAQGNHFGKPFSRVLFVGISCGFTAPYIAAQLEYAMNQDHYAVAAVGFNPTAAARSTPGSKGGPSFLSALQGLQQRSREAQHKRHFVINPILGPEAISGSTRLKGGTATKILLETIFGRAVGKVLRLPVVGNIPGASRLLVASGTDDASASQVTWQKPKGGRTDWSQVPVSSFSAILDGYEGACRAAFAATPQLEAILNLAAASLKAGGRVLYIASGGIGITALTDASEQPPTFGSPPDTFQTFVVGGWSELKRPFSNALTSSSSLPAAAGGQKLQQKSLQKQQSKQQQQQQAEGNGAVPNGGDAEGERQGLERESDSGDSERSEISLNHFLQTVLPNIRPIDTLLLLESSLDSRQLPQPLIDSLLEKLIHDLFNLAVISVHPADHDRLLCFTPETEADGHGDDDDDGGARTFQPSQSASQIFAEIADACVKISLPAAAAAPILPRIDSFGEIAMKTALNSISTGAQVLAGKVYLNKMIDLRLSNEKLFDRAVKLIVDIAGVTEMEAVASLRRSIYGVEILESDKTTDVRAAAKLEKVVPTAILIAKRRLPPSALGPWLSASGKGIRAALASGLLKK